MKRIFGLTALLAFLLVPFPGRAWEQLCKGVSVDRTVYDFGDIVLNSGPVSCAFTLRNDGQKPILIDRVTTSCGCTTAQWTTRSIQPGQTGSVTITYKNDEGAFPFDKSASVFLSCSERSCVLRVRGVCHDKPIVLEEVYTHVLGGKLGVKSPEIKGGVLEQGGQRSECFLLANLTDKPVTLDFSNTPRQVKLHNLPLTVPARQSVRVDFTLSSDARLWGKNSYLLTPVIDGRSAKESLNIQAVTQMNASRLSPEEKRNGPRITFKQSTYAFGKARSGKTIETGFSFSNTGKAPLEIYKIDADEGVVNYEIRPDADSKRENGNPILQPGESATLTVRFDTGSLPKGETLLQLRLVTNSPLRPLADVFISGWIE
ncbi:MAG: DUF1573 domain-containing protein [Bacteroidales bacterium]|nr:DUF1573 domain-containing protein [Bacteroidales bacterium]